MDKNKVKFLLQTAEEDICILVGKFLDATTFSLMDLCYWWDPSKDWWDNRKSAELVIKVLAEEGCCVRVAGQGKFTWVQTQAFVALLKLILRIETILKETKDAR